MIVRLRAAALFFILAIAFFWQQLGSDRVLLPADALFQFPPWRDYAEEFGVVYPHNPLIADTILQNYGWKQFAGSSWRAGQPPLWNPSILAGQPFLAAGQNASLYPLGVLYWLLPLGQAYEVFAALHLALAGLFTYAFLRAIGVGAFGGLVGGVTFAFSGFLIVSLVWPMMVSTAIWLPLLLCAIEKVLGVDPTPNPSPQAGRGGRLLPPRLRGGLSDWSDSDSSEGWGRPLWLATGAVVVALQFLAGHLETSFYLLSTAGLYTAFRLGARLRTHAAKTLGLDAALLGMIAAGALVAAIQIVPFVEAIGQNVRAGQVTFEEVQGYAFDRGQWWAFALPDFFGNPTHRTYLDLVDGAIRSVEHTRPMPGGGVEFRRDTAWGPRNYVEGTAYLGVLPLLLAGLALLARRSAAVLSLAAIALISLLLAFGTSLYALVFYGLPGANQLHTPFRWVYPCSFCLAALAGAGADALARSSSRVRPARMLGAASLVGGLALAVGAALGLAGRVDLIEVVGNWLARSRELQAGFGDARVLFSYVLPQLMGLALLLMASGALLLLGRPRSRLAQTAILALLVGDLFSFGMWFNPATEPRLLDFEPPALGVLRQQPGPTRLAALGPDDVLPANLAMRAGLQDIRGYDTIISRDYVDYVGLIEMPGALLFSKIEKLYDVRSLASPFLDALNVGYVITTRPVDLPHFVKIYDEGALIYRNDRALPRAYVVYDARSAASREEALAMLRRPDFDPRVQVVLEGTREAISVAGLNGGRAPQPATPAQIERYTANEVVVRVRTEGPGYLILADSFFPGWVALVDGVDQPIIRANRALRAVPLPPGEHEVRFTYQPLSFRLGLLLSAVGLASIALILSAALWFRPEASAGEAGALRRLLRNAAAPLGANLINRALDLVLALVMFRALGPGGVGAYTFAVVLVGYLDILVGFGLNTLVTRDAARYPERTASYWGNGLAMRAGFWSLAAIGTWIALSLTGGALGAEGDLALAVTLLVIALLPAAASAAVSALFQARERFDVPAAVTVFTALLKVTLGIGALILGWGYVGLAGVAVVTNVLTSALLILLARPVLRLPRPRLDRPLAWAMLAASYPLMLNQLLNTLFFRVDAVLLKPLAGDLALGWYSAAYRLIDAFQIIPSSLVLALFPRLARQADDRYALVRDSSFALRALLSLAFPVAVGTTLLAEPVIGLLAGAAYVPQSVLALQILIWYLPLSFTNGLAQYMLIALNRQRTITLAFLFGFAVNLAANLLLIPRYGYLAAAYVTVASEAVLFVPFWLALRREGAALPLLSLAWRPGLAAAVMGLAVWPLASLGLVATVIGGVLFYVAALIGVRGATREEMGALRKAIQR